MIFDDGVVICKGSPYVVSMLPVLKKIKPSSALFLPFSTMNCGNQTILMKYR
jgi:hypothetical protein